MIVLDVATISGGELLAPRPGAVELAQWLYLRRMLRGYVTSWPAGALEGVRRWLEAHGFPPAPLVQDGGERAQAMRLMRGEVLVTDSPEEALEAAQGGVMVLLLDAPYNRHIQHPHVFRYHNHAGLLDLLKALPLDTRARRDPLGWPEKKKEGRRG